MSIIRAPQGTVAVRETPRMSAHPAVRDLQERVASLTAHLGDEALAAVLPVLADVRRELARELADWLRRHPQDGDERWTAAKYRALMLQVREALRVCRDIAPALYDGLRTTGRTAGEVSMRVLADQVATLSRTFGQPVLLDLPVAAILAQGQEQLIPRFARSAERYGEDAARRIGQRLASGWLKGESWAQMARRLASLGAVPGDDVQATPAGVARGLWLENISNAYRVARTEGMNALNVHQQLGLEAWSREEPGAMKLWDGSQDRACPRCRALDGIALPVRGYFHDPVVGAIEHPTLHPHCRCCIRPHHIDWR